MLYLLDANVLITAHNSYYPVDGVPEFWAWLCHKGSRGEIKLPAETYEEVKFGSNDDAKDPLLAWIKDNAVKSALLFEEEISPALVANVVDKGYAPDLTDDEVDQLGRDPFLIAYAAAAPADRCVVTVEVSKPKRIRQNRHIPDVCASLGVKCCDTFTMLRSLQFRTTWK